jgi:hypothetical protein
VAEVGINAQAKTAEHARYWGSFYDKAHFPGRDHHQRIHREQAVAEWVETMTAAWREWSRNGNSADFTVKRSKIALA